MVPNSEANLLLLVSRKLEPVTNGRVMCVNRFDAAVRAVNERVSMGSRRQVSKSFFGLAYRSNDKNRSLWWRLCALGKVVINDCLQLPWRRARKIFVAQ
jgi:hypothetical protein